MAENDSEIDLKKRARRRLVGSAALALTAAIVLPMVMDHEPRIPSQDVQIRLPSQEGSNFASRVITGKASELPPPGTIIEETAPPEMDDAQGGAAQAQPSLPPPLFKPGEELLPPPKKNDAVRTEPVRSEPKPDPRQEMRLKEKEREREREREREKERDKEKARERAEAERAKALLMGGAPKDPGKEAGSVPHLVSLGAYREAGNVNSLRAKLKAEGYPSYTEQLGDKVRVRAGPFPNKAAADKAAARISRILGVPASVVPKS
ncbi:SPOR domain-containing protein [Zoogloea sp.]|uniref:SPOR domain-containing protein n=1 Tax=Zoogloea sp. TaxID=49181 RepID=UPI002618683C|nr:SPOR domain-containing protein [Zoogloea sp.]MDD3353230.1 SPOR domain-containing protein [Zoogloea sp.]